MVYVVFVINAEGKIIIKDIEKDPSIVKTNARI